MATTTRRGSWGGRWALACAGALVLAAAAQGSARTVTTTDELRQGSVNATVTLHGTGLAAATALDFGADVTVHGFTAQGGGSRLLVTVSVADLAAAGDRTVTVTLPADTATGTIRCTFPGDLLPEGFTDDREPSRNPAVVAVNVFGANGEFFMSRTDVATRGRMMGLAWSRNWQSNNVGFNGSLGRGWVGYYFQRAVYVASGARPGIRWYTPEGRTELFPARGPGQFGRPAGVYMKAERDAVTGAITLTDRHGFQCFFDGVAGKLQKCRDRNGNESVCRFSATTNQLEAVEDDLGRRYEIEYYAHGRVRRVVDKVWSTTAPRVVEYTYTSAGELATVKAPETARYADASGNRTTYAYAHDAAHRIVACTNPREVAAGGPPYLTITYDAQGRVIEQRLGEVGRNLYVRYLQGGSLVRTVDRRSLRTDCKLDSKGRCVEESRFTGFWAVDTVAPLDHGTVTQTGAQVRASDPAAFVTETRFNADHEVTQVAYPRANRVVYTFDEHAADPLAQGNLLEVRRQDRGLGSEPDIVSTFVYEPRFQFVKRATDPRLFTTTYLYDYEALTGSAGNLVRGTYPPVTLGQPTPQVITEETDYNGFGQPTERRDGEGFRTTYIYGTSGDDTGYLVAVLVDADTLSLRTEFAYNRAGLLIGRWSPRAFAGVGRDDTFKTSFDVNELEQTFHTVGRVLRAVGGASDRSDVYRGFDLNGNLEFEMREYVQADGTEPSAPSDVNDPSTFPKSATAMAATWAETSHSYNLLNYRTATTVDAVAGAGPGGAPHTLTSQLFYDPSDNVQESRTPLGFRHTTTYDERDLVHTQTRGAGTSAAGTYTTNVDANGNVVETLDALSNPTSVTLDGFDRVVRVTDAASHFSTTAYDPSSNVIDTTSFDASGTLLARALQTWDEIDRNFRVARVAVQHDGVLIGGDGLAVSTTLHDRNSRVTRTVDPNGVATVRGYDGANRVVLVQDNVTNEVVYHYNPDSAVTQTDFRERNGLTAALEISHTEVLLDPLNRRLAFRDQRFDPLNRDTQVDFVLDGWSRTVTMRDARDVETSRAFDLLSRRTRTIRKPSANTSDWIVTDESYDDDSRVTARRVYRDGAAALEPQTTSYTFDSRDRLTAVTRPDADTWNISWDAQSNRTGWVDPIGTQVADTFDPRNLVTQRVISRGTGIRGATREAYTFDGLRRLTAATSFETRGATEDTLVAQTWTYNTLSRAERHGQTLYDDTGALLGSWTTQAAFDRAELTTRTVFGTGLALDHAYDGLNRLATTSVAGGGGPLASYAYAGPSRLIQRVYDNGVVTKIAYESAGCGCGGFSGFVEDVRHERSATDPTPVFRSERRYDVLGNVTAERWGHRGGQGSVFRYDDTYRLEDTYQGVDLSGTQLATLADPSTTPSAFALRRHYALDTRGNRTATVDEDAAAASLRTVAYSPNAATNVYDSVDGQGFTFDVLEQLTFDPTTGLYTTYDYRGQRVAVDNNSDGLSPERAFIHDAHGRLRVEIHRTGGAAPVRAYAFTYLPEMGSPPVVADEIHFGPSGGGFAASGGSRVFVTGLGAAGSGGCGGALNPMTATALPRGSTVGSFVILGRATDGVSTEARSIHEDQLGSTLGFTDHTGATIREYHSTDYGVSTSLRAVFDSGDGTVASVSHAGGVSTLTLALGAPAPVGHERRLIRGIGAGGSGIAAGTIIAVTPTTVQVWDPANAFGGLTAARLVVYAPADPTAPARTVPASHGGTVTGVTVMGPVTHLQVAGADFSTVTVGDAIHVQLAINGGGPQHHWTEVLGVVGAPPDTVVVRTLPEYAGAPGMTIAIHPIVTGGQRNLAGAWGASATLNGGVRTQLYAERFLPTDIVGFHVQVGAAVPLSFEITSVSGRVLEVTGDVRSLVSQGAAFVILAPVGVDADTAAPYTGTLGTDARSVWAGYFHLSPVVGQSGINLSGDEHAWNRVYFAAIGRWGVPDPASCPWTNLQDYARTSPVARFDRTGLKLSHGPTGPAGPKEPPCPEPEPPLDPEPVDGPCCCAGWVMIKTKGSVLFKNDLFGYFPDMKGKRNWGDASKLGPEHNPERSAFKFEAIGMSLDGWDSTPEYENCTMTHYMTEVTEGGELKGNGWKNDPQDHGRDVNTPAGTDNPEGYAGSGRPGRYPSLGDAPGQQVGFVKIKQYHAICMWSAPGCTGCQSGPACAYFTIEIDPNTKTASYTDGIPDAARGQIPAAGGGGHQR